MFRLLVIALFAALIVGCEPKRPDYVLPPQEMEAVIYDLMRIDGACDQNLVMHCDSTRHALYNSLLEKQGITVEQFDSSLTWYALHIDDFEIITANVTQRLKNERNGNY